MEIARQGVELSTRQKLMHHHLARPSTVMLPNKYAHASDAAVQAATNSLPQPRLCPAVSSPGSSCKKAEKPILRITRTG